MNGWTNGWMDESFVTLSHIRHFDVDYRIKKVWPNFVFVPFKHKQSKSMQMYILLSWLVLTNQQAHIKCTKPLTKNDEMQ